MCSQELEYRREKPVAKYLTKKERSIVLQMIEGATSNDIAQKMDCSIHTINNQKNHLIKKFNCNTSPELVAKLFRMGYIKI
ncbi:MAG: helix-turn-helix transcriptional regulator [Saprospiraceae bacterium]|nr:helix-turn-helix transcriptional regulator [Saprospiraceae bacterium]